MSGKKHDVFLSHNSADKAAVEFIARKLHDEHVNLFFDKWNLVPGQPWQEEIEEALSQSATCAVFQGPHGPGTWENEEMRAALAFRANGRTLRVFAVFLPGSIPDRVDLPLFLKRFTWIDFSSGLEDSDAFWRLLCGIRDLEPGPPRSRLNPNEEAPDRVDRPPYRGIFPFSQDDAALFFGRDTLTKYLVERLRNHHFLAVIGPSGSGKSSLVRAGLIPALRNGALPGSKSWSILPFRPAHNPVRELAARLFKDLEDPDVSISEEIERLVTAMRSSPYALATEVRRMARSHILLVVDQFEEVFTLTSDSDRQALFANLLDATGLVSAKISVVVTLRADFYASVAAYPDLADRIAARQVIVTPMQESDLAQAITGPAELSRLRFEKDLDYEILREMDGQTGALPLLQHALLQLWERREGNTLTYAAYKTIGYVKGSIARWADSVYKKLSTIQQASARRILVELVQPEGNARRRVPQKEIITGPYQTPETMVVLAQLIDARILTTDGDATNQDSLVEIAHEALLREWLSLREWIESSRASRLTRSQFQERIRAWEGVDRDQGSLVRGAELDLFEIWSRENPGEVGPKGREYLEACREAQSVETELRREATRHLREAKSLDFLDRRGATVQTIQSVSRQNLEFVKSGVSRLPDLEITIRVEKSFSLFEINAPDEGLNAYTLRAEALPSPETYLSHLFRDIENLPLDTAEASAIATQKLGAKGLIIWDLFPRELQEILWRHRRGVQTLLIESDEPYIPWEIARLQSWDDQGQKIIGPFLCEAFEVTRWIRGSPHITYIPIDNLALVAPDTSRPKTHAVEQVEIRKLAEHYSCEVTNIEPTFQAVRQAMTSGVSDGWHFAGYHASFEDDANRWGIELNDLTSIHTEDLLAEASNRGLERSFAFLNGCITGSSVFTSISPGGWARGFLNAGAGAFVGTYWEIAPENSREIAIAVYKNLFDGKPIGEAIRLARRQFQKRHKGDLSWLAYTVFAHPLAICEPSTQIAPRDRVVDQMPEQLTISTRSWRKDIDPPGALLRAQYGVVPFHRRETELRDLLAWCQDPSPVRIRLYTGPGGAGKTRLAHEVALQIRDQGWWAGFVTSEALHFPARTWEALARPEGKVLMIVDYAETNPSFLISILRSMYRTKSRQIRLLLLARDGLDWWEKLKREGDGVTEILTSQATSTYSLLPLADSLDARLASYVLAAHAFSQLLQVATPSPPTDLDTGHFENGLLLHMRALIDVEEEEKVQGEDGILDRIVARERKFWEVHARERGLPPEFVPGIGPAMAIITLVGGVEEEKQAVAVLRRLRFFEDKPEHVLVGVACLLHEIYPGKRWIEPLQPDLLGEHLAQRELDKGEDKLLDLMVRPRSEGLR